MAEETTTTTTVESQNDQNQSQNEQTTSTTVNSTQANGESQSNQNQSQNTSIEELIQRAVDRATNKLGNDNKKLRESLEKLKKENLTAEQRKELELKEKEADIADREAKLKEKENREYALKAIKEVGLDDGSSNSLELIDFVVCDNDEDTLGRVNTFNELVKKFVKAEVDKTFKAHGRNPNASGSSATNSTNASFAETLGKRTAEMHKQTENVLNHYIGGN